MPQPSHFAHDMREYFEQHIPFIGRSLHTCTLMTLAFPMIWTLGKFLPLDVVSRLTYWMLAACAGFQHGFDFLSAYLDADTSPSRTKGEPDALARPITITQLDGRQDIGCEATAYVIDCHHDC